MTDHKIPLAGVIGCPIAHSKSPLVHGHWLKRYGISGHYIPLHVEPGDLADTLAAMMKMGFVGCNITLPHKLRALELANTITDRASLIGAAKTLTFGSDGKIHADNTDGYGFLANLKQGAPDWAPASGPALVLGAGGAARAVLATLIEAGVPEIFLANRTRSNADALKCDFGAKIKVIEWVQAGNSVSDAATVVNTTSLGMTGGHEFRVPMDGLRPETVVTDLVYNPLRTPLLNAAEKAGCVTVDGLGMLLHQAVPGFERWFGQRPEVDDELRSVVLS